jgi:hypothetical protein
MTSSPITLGQRKPSTDKNYNPFAFKFSDNNIRKENAANYIPPQKRKVLKDHLANSSINLHTLSSK